jgi:putative ABC transport system substrate-binding protein
LVGGSKQAADRFSGGFLQGMRELGYAEGRDYGFEVRYADGDMSRIPSLTEIQPLFRRNLEAPAKALGVELVASEARSRDDLQAALKHLAHADAKIVLALQDTMYLNERKRIALFAVAERLPTVFGFRENVDDGGLMSYGTDLRESWRRAASFVDKILKGAKPADLPIEFPTKLQLVINLTTAKALGLEIPPTLLARADEVIE